MRSFRSSGSRAVAAAVLVITAAPSAAAQSSSDQAAAEALFRQGRELVAAGQFAAACPKFAESQRLDPAPGTLLNLANCYEKNGQLASAWVTYKEAATSARKADQVERARMARDKAAELEAGLPLLTIQVSTAADRPELQVRRDGALVGRAEWATPIPVDPGTHVVEAVAAGMRPWRASAVLVGPGSKASIEVPALEPLAEHGPAAGAVFDAAGPNLPGAGPVRNASGAPAPGGTAAPGSIEGGETRHAPPGGAPRAAGWALGGIGLAGGAAGAILGALAIADKNASADHCINTTCDAQGYASNRDGRRLATASTIAFIAGGALLATGIALVVWVPRERAGGGGGVAVGPTVGDGIGAAVRGAW